MAITDPACSSSPSNRQKGKNRRFSGNLLAAGSRIDPVRAIASIASSFGSAGPLKVGEKQRVTPLGDEQLKRTKGEASHALVEAHVVAERNQSGSSSPG